VRSWAGLEAFGKQVRKGGRALALRYLRRDRWRGPASADPLDGQGARPARRAHSRYVRHDVQREVHRRRREHLLHTVLAGLIRRGEEGHDLGCVEVFQLNDLNDGVRAQGTRKARNEQKGDGRCPPTRVHDHTTP